MAAPRRTVDEAIHNEPLSIDFDVVIVDGLMIAVKDPPDTRYAGPSSHNCSSGPFRVQQHAMVHTVAKQRGWIRVVCLVPCDFWKVAMELQGSFSMVSDTIF